MSGYEWVQYFVHKHRLKRERIELRDRWNLYLWAKECAKAYQLILNMIISTHFEHLLITTLKQKTECPLYCIRWNE